MEETAISLVVDTSVHEYMRKELELIELLNELDKLELEELLQLECPKLLKDIEGLHSKK